MTKQLFVGKNPDHATRPDVSPVVSHFVLSTITPDSVPLDEDMDSFLLAKDMDFITSIVPTLAYVWFLMMAGLVGNTIVFLVYYKRFKPGETRSFILAMSVCDMCMNALGLPLDIVELRFHNSFRDDWACKMSRTVKSFLSCMSGSILLAVALDRYRKICQLHHIPTTYKYVRRALTFSFLASFIVTIPYTVLTGIQTVYFNSTNMTGSKCSIDDAYVHSTFLVVYNVSTGIMFVTCVVTMAASYLKIAQYLKNHAKQSIVVLSARDMAVRRATVVLRSKMIPRKDSYPIGRSSMEIQLPDRPNQVKAEINSISSMQDIEPSSSLPEVFCTEFLNKADPYDESPTSLTDSEITAPPPTPVQRKFAVSEEFRDSKPPGTVQSESEGESNEAPRSTFVLGKGTSKYGDSVKKIPTQTTWTMFVLTVIFVVNYLPYLLAVNLRFNRELLEQDLGLNVYHIIIRSYFINSVANPIVYSFCSVRFRQECRHLLCCRN